MNEQFKRNSFDNFITCGLLFVIDCRPAKCFYITSLSCDKVLDVKGDKASAGSPVILFERKAEISPNQLWYEDEHGILRSKLNGYVMDSSGSLTYPVNGQAISLL